jgi:hypothetical protein
MWLSSLAITIRPGYNRYIGGIEMSAGMNAPQVRIEPWGDGDLTLLRLLNAPEMTEHLGGPETEEQILARHKRYLEIEGTGRMYRIVLLPDLETVVSVGYWDRNWQEKTVYEIGWGVLPKFQGRGIATEAVAEAIVLASNEQKHSSFMRSLQSTTPLLTQFAVNSTSYLLVSVTSNIQ